MPLLAVVPVDNDRHFSRLPDMIFLYRLPLPISTIVPVGMARKSVVKIRP